MDKRHINPLEGWDTTTRNKVTFNTAFAELDGGADITSGNPFQALALAKRNEERVALALAIREEERVAQARRMEGWIISAEDQSAFDAAFRGVDTTKKGYLTGEPPPIVSRRVLIVGEESVRFFLTSKLPDEVLAQIWDLADITKQGRLYKDTFAVSMHLIGLKIRGIYLPPKLPASLVPPRFRKSISAATTDSRTLEQGHATPATPTADVLPVTSQLARDSSFGPGSGNSSGFRVDNEFNWTTGNDESLVHQKKLDRGAYGEVHQVIQGKSYH